MGSKTRRGRYEASPGAHLRFFLAATTTLLLVKITPGVLAAEDQDPIHTKLRNLLFRGYEKNIIPIKKSNQSVGIALGVSLIHIESLKEGVLTASAWLRMVWNDYRLQWDESKFGGVNVLRVYPSDIWLPDIEVYNAKEYREFSLAAQYRNEPCMALVYPDGEVLFIPPVDIKVICANFSFTAGPMEEQECNIKLGSWTRDGDIMNITLFNNKPQMDLSDFANSSSPYMVTRHIEGVRNVKRYTCCEEPYIDLNFRFALKRQFPAREDPAEQLLFHLLGVAVAILVLLLTTIVGAAFFVRRGAGLRQDNFKLVSQNSTESSNIPLI